MVRTALAATALLFAVPATVPLFAQSQQEPLDARYDRALAAGYKALMLCSAIANAELREGKRTAESVMAWELTGIQPPLDNLVRAMPIEIVRSGGGVISHVSVGWDADAKPRIARYDMEMGCTGLPIGADEPSRERVLEANETIILTTSHPRRDGSLHSVGEAAFDGDTYGAATRSTSVIVRADDYDLVSMSVADFPNVFATPQRTWSVAKSIAATLVGAAVYRGDADVTASAGLGESSTDPRRAITIDHLLRMASGRYSDTPGNRTNPLYWGGATVDEVALDWPLIAAPGTSYRYANNDTLAAVAAIKPTFGAHPPAAFFAKLG